MQGNWAGARRAWVVELLVYAVAIFNVKEGFLRAHLGTFIT